MKTKINPKPNKNAKKSLKQADTSNTENAAGLHTSVAAFPKNSGRKASDSESEVFFQNNLYEIILKKTGAEKFHPTGLLLKKLGMSKIRFNKLYRKTANPTFDESIRIIQHFHVRFEVLYSEVDPSDTDATLDEQFLRKYGNA
jgi:hypothetical protein